MQLYPLLFNDNLHTMVWGFESWVASAITASPSVVANGSHAGSTLPQLVSELGQRLLGQRTKGTEFPLLVKFIDARQNLSVQVHPNDRMARRLHGLSGKTEMWLVVKADEGAGVYSGFRKRVTKAEYERRVKDGTICEVLEWHEVSPGDVLFIPAGRPHAIGGGVKLAEIQQSSYITYRIYDYNRPGLDGRPRELHTELAAKALDYKVHDDYLQRIAFEDDVATPVVECPVFTVNVLNMTRPMQRPLLERGSFVLYTATEGGCIIVAGGTQVSLEEGRCCLVPAAIADVTITPKGPRARLAEAYV